MLWRSLFSRISDDLCAMASLAGEKNEWTITIFRAGRTSGIPNRNVEEWSAKRYRDCPFFGPLRDEHLIPWQKSTIEPCCKREQSSHQYISKSQCGNFESHLASPWPFSEIRDLDKWEQCSGNNVCRLDISSVCRKVHEWWCRTVACWALKKFQDCRYVEISISMELSSDLNWFLK